ncbi:putative proteinase inhibitor I3, Kunitz legume, kunitz inhibitor STI-like superfamily [Helianthus annuus]|nr:putative proteinase inhibitor I3, Kunitz legume, kunitz inhibitor STI-like superfamily [Helianthus annuus]
MNTIILIIISLSFIILAANSAPTPASVLDIHGKHLRTGAKYIARLLNGRSDGGLYVMEHGKKPCSPDVVAIYNQEEGLPLTFTPVNPKKGVIRLYTDVNIKFSGSNSCNVSNVWKLNYDIGMEQYVVMVGGVEGNPGPETLMNWFNIEKTNDGYKLVFCNVRCMGVGIVQDKDGWQHLALSNDPLSFAFAPI